MLPRKISFYFDLIISSVLLFLLFFCWIRFYTKNLFASIIGGICATFVCIFLFSIIKNKRNEKIQLNSKQKKLALDCALQLMFTSQGQVQKYFETIFKEKYKTTKTNGGLKIVKENFCAFFFPAYSVEVLQPEHLAQIISFSSKISNQIFISVNQADNKTLELAKSIKNIKITIYNYMQTYEKIISKQNILPEQVIDTSIVKPTYKQLIEYAFSPSRSKNYWALGLILLLSSFFVAFKIYYLISGSILILIGIIVKFLPNKHKNDNKIELL